MTNHLANTTSPYLLQHARNPVDWYPWGPEALEKARREEKPIFLSIGYAACHWCHVMAHESFENPETAAIMNEHYVSIKVDREERPDLDGTYMSAVTAMTGQGGWPMSVFLAPDLRPFYAGTYFPPEPRHGLPGFKELLLTLAEAWTNQRDEIARVGAEVASRLEKEAQGSATGKFFDRAGLEQAAKSLVESADRQFGGWGRAPKFPQPMSIEFLLRRHSGGDEQALEPAVQALRAMAQGGMVDVVGGGFARYSTDNYWRVPHFEKMLYDNAQLALAYLHAWQVTRTEDFRKVTEATLDFVLREMSTPEGGFTSSIDADSEGEEGKYYAWTLEEIRQALGGDAAFFEFAYGVTAAGNWEGKTVLKRAVDDASLAARFNLPAELVRRKLTDCHKQLLKVRHRRVRPGRDDKVLTAWNGLMLRALAEAGKALDNPEYVRAAQANADFLLEELRPAGRLRRAWREGRAGEEVFLEDYAALILGLLALYQTDFNNRWFAEACSLAEKLVEAFADPAGGFFDTPAGAETVLIRPKDLQDNATPCGNSLAAEALLRLAALTGRDDWQRTAEGALGLVAEAAPLYPTSFAGWLSAADLALGKVKQVAILGNSPDEEKPFLELMREAYRPNLVVAASVLPLAPNAPALLADRPLVQGRPTAYVCEGFVCRLPVTEAGELEKQLG